jgi:hypothetical protein
LYFRLAVGKAAVFLQRLSTQLDAVHEEHDFIGVMRIGDELRRFEAGHGFPGTGGVPYIAAGSSWGSWPLFPITFPHHIRDGVCRDVLITTQHLKASIR